MFHNVPLFPVKSEYCINPVQDGWDLKRIPYHFFSVTSTNVGISPENFLVLIFCSTGVKLRL